MASTDGEVSHIIDLNKENSVHSEQYGIEANDLASLLNRFEEATTSSSDDLSIPTRIPKSRREMLMRAKSCGSSPAVTPPATPPPYGRKQFISGPQVQQPVSTHSQKAAPIQLKFFLPSTSTGAQTSFSSSAKSGTKVSLPIQIMPASAVKNSGNHTSLLNKMIAINKNTPSNKKTVVRMTPVQKQTVVQTVVSKTSTKQNSLPPPTPLATTVTSSSPKLVGVNSLPDLTLPTGNISLSIFTPPNLRSKSYTAIHSGGRGQGSYQLSAGPQANVPKGSHSKIFIQKPSLSKIHISSQGASTAPGHGGKTPTIVGLKNVPRPATISYDAYMKRRNIMSVSNSSVTNISSANDDISQSNQVVASQSSISKSQVVAISSNPVHPQDNEAKSYSALRIGATPNKSPLPSPKSSPLPSPSLLKAAQNVSLLQSMLETKAPLNTKGTSTQLSEKLTARVNDYASLNKPYSNSKVKITNSAPAQPVTKQIKIENSVPKTSVKTSQDHDYCFLTMSIKDIVQETIGNVKNNPVASVNVEPKDEDQEFTKFEPSEFINFGDAPNIIEEFGASIEEAEDHFCPDSFIAENGIQMDHLNEISIQDINEICETVTGDVTDFSGHNTLSLSDVQLSLDDLNEFVLEEGEFPIDEYGNDPVQQENSNSCDKLGESSAGRIVSFRGDDPTGGKRRAARKYRKQAEFSTSPVREDNSTFFNKIPSYYTALSIPTKPTKTSVFATANGALGVSDHLELIETAGTIEEEGLYNKVPAHHRHFTNTTRDIEPDLSDTMISDNEAQSKGNLESSPKHSSKVSPSHRKRRKSSGHSDYHARSRSPRSPSASGSRESRSRKRTVSQGSGRSMSSCSTCSSHSYCSTCSGRSSSGSRSRSRSISQSRSPSVGRQRSCERSARSRSNGSNRSRSRSAGRRRDYKNRGHRSRRHFSPMLRDRHSRSRSRSTSPAHKSRLRSRSHRHRARSHSSADRLILQRRKEREEEKVKAMEDRRVVYVGKIPESYTKRHLHKRFERFGEIKEVKVNFREHGDNYGFVTFAYSCDAIAAKERGNNVPGELKFDLCFGGRRRFCPDQYADLDGNREIEEEYAPMGTKMSGELDYAALLKQHTTQQKKKR